MNSFSKRRVIEYAKLGVTSTLRYSSLVTQITLGELITTWEGDYDQFKEEVLRACNYVRSKMSAEKELRCRDVGADCDYVIRGKTEGRSSRKPLNMPKRSTI